jgi:threonylcarbamoyladenosine tRNA methylthiotransferase MtaB
MLTHKKVAFYTLGCKLNFSETSTIARTFIENGYEKVDFEQASDVYVINTCSVTENADKECKKIVKKALKAAPNAYVVVVGCYAQLKPEAIGAWSFRKIQAARLPPESGEERDGRNFLLRHQRCAPI